MVEQHGFILEGNTSNLPVSVVNYCLLTFWPKSLRKINESRWWSNDMHDSGTWANFLSSLLLVNDLRNEASAPLPSACRPSTRFSSIVARDTRKCLKMWSTKSSCVHILVILLMVGCDAAPAAQVDQLEERGNYSDSCHGNIFTQS